MQPFQLPAFYMPDTARLNPSLERAGQHTRAWAQAMGMVDAQQADGGFQWDTATLESQDYALLTAYTHPDATAGVLDVVTDWYVWVFYFDEDFLTRFKRTQDVAGAH